MYKMYIIIILIACTCCVVCVCTSDCCITFPQFLCWENWQYSMIVLNDLLTEVRVYLYNMYVHVLYTCILHTCTVLMHRDCTCACMYTYNIIFVLPSTYVYICIIYLFYLHIIMVCTCCLLYRFNCYNIVVKFTCTVYMYIYNYTCTSNCVNRILVWLLMTLTTVDAKYSDSLSQIMTVQVFDTRPLLELLSHILLIQDTWQNHRITTALRGQYM